MWTSLGHGPATGMRSLRKIYSKPSIGITTPSALLFPGVWNSGAKQQQQAQQRARALSSAVPAAADPAEHDIVSSRPAPSPLPQYDSDSLGRSTGESASIESGGRNHRSGGTRSSSSSSSSSSDRHREASGGNAGNSRSWKKIRRTPRYDDDGRVSVAKWESQPNHSPRHGHGHDNFNNGNGYDRSYPSPRVRRRETDPMGPPGVNRTSESHRLKVRSSSATSSSSSSALSPSVAAAAAPANEPSWAVIGLNQQLKDAKTCQQLVRVLRNPRPGALTAVNVATAWVRLGNLQSRGGGRKHVGAGAGADAAGEEEGAEMAACMAAVRQLLEPTALAAAEMELRQIANTLWGMAKIGENVLYAQGGREGDGNRLPYASTSPAQVLQQLQRRAIELLQLLAPRSGDGSSSDGVRQRAPHQLDLRDATQLWYGMGGLNQHPWSDAVCSTFEEATLQAMETAVLDEHSGRDVNAAPAAGGGRTGGGGSGGWEADLTAVAQIVFRMACVSGAKMSPEHKARLTAVIDALSYGSDALSSPLENPDCLLVGAQLLKLDLAKETVRRLHDMALTLLPPAAARTGRTAMARALNSAVGLGLQPSASEARRWERRLLEELTVDGGGYDRWTCEGLSWTMLALSGVKAYLPGEEARGILLGGLRRVVRQMRANDATRVQHAMRAWGLRLPEREAELLRRKASSGGDAEWSEPRPRGGGDYGVRSWGFGR
ncbi:hypothetical protein Vretimale_14488 [Volvox reticuliferus]|uniref:Uncharacterized protein n=1 Tax=Volvox reticuliferus TaxID=1737510 RepID=A0A8J4GP73_9CHLO|nr:hypothetical protein Vretifemale_13346 [Volvox reticuliferus]GIM10880.1 hypothetical protein Vretimale_14488 [Volvox reticuliferus]